MNYKSTNRVKTVDIYTICFFQLVLLKKKKKF